MRIDSEIKKAKFIKRPNRFVSYVDIDGEEVIAHVPNTGRCKELLIEGVDVILRKGKTPNRKTLYDLISVYKGDMLVNIDSQAPNRIVHEGIQKGLISKLSMYTEIKREKKHGNSRIDFYLTNDSNEYYLEVKGVTLEEDGVVMFPDAPTDRGTRHIYDLIGLNREGKGAGIMFLIQLEGAKYFTPNKERDPKFYEALKKAEEEGLDIMAYECIVKEDEIIMNKEVEVRI